MPPSSFAARHGFERDAVRLDNWRQAPWNVWAFRNVGELVPSMRIRASARTVDEAVGDPLGILATHAAALLRSSTDAFVVMKHGRVIADYYAADFGPQDQHIVFSISKSITGLLAGLAEGEGLLDPEAPVSLYVPEIAGSVYADATVRHLLDMLITLDFEEDYLDTSGNYGRYRRAVLWHPAETGQPSLDLVGFLASLKKGPGDHGGAVSYKSPNSDMLGLVVERACGQRYADFASARLWKPMGAAQDALITVDGAGAPRAAGGISMTVGDLARVGEMMRNGGRSQTGEQVLPEAWVEDTTRTGGSSEAWLAGGNFWLPDGRYRNQWYQTGYPSGAFAAIGVHGQWLYVDPSAGVVIAKLSSQPLPVDEECDRLCLSLFQAICAAA
ncbi:serine hydrolase domain-containing protein [Shinella sp.]|uniref:serine hydrolase domain-containing protein n=1 Tax=Shinella sp. TaxID=1870904 RepID=UPI003F6FD3DD